ncbi:hypothetical protein R1flu_002367 [Riccia fluitans]|uniref:Uncharacterized protein n=1 Tax=Riccia fluitans TaxID=41844 RepID=A0ABD1Y8V3_9MARC
MGRNSKACLAFLCLVQLLITTIAVESQNVDSYSERLESKRINTRYLFAPEFYWEILREKKITVGGRSFSYVEHYLASGIHEQDEHFLLHRFLVYTRGSPQWTFLLLTPSPGGEKAKVGTDVE